MSKPFDPLHPWFSCEPQSPKPFDISLFSPPPKAPPTSLFELFTSPPPASPHATLSSLLAALAKPKVFVSYHHKNDQPWYDRFTTLFAANYELFTDTSIGRKIDSDDPIYQSRKIREDHISGSSTTIVLVGSETWKRKHVDWEISATLDKKHALLGIALPTCSRNSSNQVIVPGRLYDNIVSNFAGWINWSEDGLVVAQAIESVRQRAKTASLTVNSRPQLGRNLP